VSQDEAVISARSGRLPFVTWSADHCATGSWRARPLAWGARA